MIGRKQKMEELLEGIQSLRRHVALASVCSIKMPRITPSQWGALMFIEHGGESTVKDVAKALGITSSAATQLIDGLVASGYVERREDSKDRRKVTLTLSKTTRSHVVKMKKQVMKGLLKTFEILDDREFNQYLALNQKLVQGLTQKN